MLVDFSGPPPPSEEKKLYLSREHSKSLKMRAPTSGTGGFGMPPAIPFNRKRSNVAFSTWVQIRARVRTAGVGSLQLFMLPSPLRSQTSTHVPQGKAAGFFLRQKFDAVCSNLNNVH